MRTYTFFSDFNLTTEIDDKYYSEFMSESDAFTQTENGFEVELDDFQVIDDYTARLSIFGYGGLFEIDLSFMLDEADETSTINDYFVEGFICE